MRAICPTTLPTAPAAAVTMTVSPSFSWPNSNKDTYAVCLKDKCKHIWDVHGTRFQELVFPNIRQRRLEGLYNGNPYVVRNISSKLRHLGFSDASSASYLPRHSDSPQTEWRWQTPHIRQWKYLSFHVLGIGHGVCPPAKLGDVERPDDVIWMAASHNPSTTDRTDTLWNVEAGSSVTAAFPSQWTSNVEFRYLHCC